MKKLLIATVGALFAFAPVAAQASVRNTVIATTVVVYCNYQMGYLTIEEASEHGARYLDAQGIGNEQTKRIMNSDTFNDDVIDAIFSGGGCEKITER